MKIFKDKHTLQKEILKTKGISFVPTMGGLHKGHISLIKKSKKFQFKTLVSIFVNPTQFNKKSDFRSYPRSANKDLKHLKKLKISYLYMPTFKDIYGFKPKERIFLDKFSKKIKKQKPKNIPQYLLRIPIFSPQRGLQGFLLLARNEIFSENENELISHLSRTYGHAYNTFLINYSIVRFLIEYLREPDVQIGIKYNLFTQGQILSIPILFIGLVILYSCLYNKK